MNQKGGVGKSSLTNAVILDWRMKDLLRSQSRTGKTKVSKILLIDVDAQASLTKQRDRDIALCRAEYATIQAMDLCEKLAANEMRSQFDALNQTVEWTPYEIFDGSFSGDDNTAENVQKALTIIESNEYDYVFIDMPGSLSQQYTGELLSQVNYIIIPLYTGNYEVQSTFDFCKMIVKEILLSSKDSKLKEVRIMFNMYEQIKSSTCDTIERDLQEALNIPFLKTRVKNISYYKTKNNNSLIPSTYRINLNTLEIAPTSRAGNLHEFANELRKLVDNNSN
jgi:chromosome partitioning protein